MNCNCKEKPCGCNNCPDDEEITQLIPLDSDECSTCGGCNSCSPCSTKQCSCNIVSDSECLTVDTSECGTVHLSVECPPVVEAGENIRVDVEECSEGEGCSKKYIVNSLCKDEKVKVKACGEADYLVNLVKPGKGISITSDCNSLYINNDCCKDDPKEKILKIEGQSNLIDFKTREEGDMHILQVADKDSKPYYVKMVLKEGHDLIGVNDAMKPDEDEHEGDGIPTTYHFRGPAYNGVWGVYKNKKGDDVCKNMGVTQGYILITKKGLYQVGFSGSAEMGSGVHAFRAQLYQSRITEAGPDESYTHTLIESRYSAPIGHELFEDGYAPQFVSDVSVSGGGESPVRATVTKTPIKLDNPLRGLMTDIEGQSGKSASLGSYISRFPVGGSTIAELDVGDVLCFGAKISNQVTYRNGDFMSLIPKAERKSGHWAFLCQNSVRSGGVNTGEECGLTVYANLIHPLN